MDDFGERLKVLRKSANITQTELAERLNVHLQTVSKWERGISEPDISQMGELAKILNISIEKLFGAEESGETYDGTFSAENLGLLISALRTAKSESQQQLAEICASSEDAVSRWERGITCPDIVSLTVLAKHFEITISKLYYAVTEEPSSPIAVKAKKRKNIFVILASALAAAAVIAITVVVSLYASFNKAVSFKVMVDGAEYTVNKDEWFTPQAEAKTGYDLLGWQDADGNFVTVPYKIIEDCQFKAVYQPHEYYIEYWLNGGEFTETEVNRTFTVESGEVSLPEVGKNGAIFEGWYLTADYSGNAVTKVTCTAENKVLYAKWNDESYTVQYDLNGGVLYENNPVAVNKKQQIKLNQPLRKGYLFLGWYDVNSDEKCEFVGGAAAKNLSLQARWQKSDAVFTINYELNGGTLNSGNPAQIKAGEMVELFGSEKIGYEFIGWNQTADGSGEFVDKIYGQNADITLYAIFRPKEFLIRYVYDGIYLTEETNPNYITYGESVILKSVYRYGYDFDGWYTKEEDGVLIEKIDTENITGISTLYAHFTIHTYEIELEGNGGTFLSPEGELEYYCYLLPFNGNLVLPECNREGYNFLGWKDSAGAWVEELNISNMADMKLFAVWREKNKTYTVTFEPKGGELENGVTCEMKCGETQPLPVPDRSGYLFLGWNEKSDESGTMHEVTDPYWENNLTLYAVWQEIKVNGSSDLFKYTKGAESVTITSYKGDYGKDVDVVFPSVIEGLPVSSIKCHFIGSVDLSNSKPYWTFRSVYIPEGVKELGESLFCDTKILQPLTIPASVVDIGANCFKRSFAEIYFAEGNQIETIREEAFYQANIPNVLVLPSTVKTIQGSAFSGVSIGGIVLPEGLTTIMDNGCSGAYLYLPSTISYLGKYAVSKAYVSMSKEDATGLDVNLSRGTIVYNHTAHNIALRDGDREEKYFEKYLVLPKPEKQGYTFLGWQNEKGEFVNSVFIPNNDSVLTAVYEQQSANDGRTKGSAMVLKLNQVIQFTVRSGEMIYFVIDTPKDISCIITVNNNLNNNPDILFNETVKKDEEFSYSTGKIICFKVGSIPSSAVLTIKVMQV